jgi:hypothetical protein
MARISENRKILLYKEKKMANILGHLLLRICVRDGTQEKKEKNVVNILGHLLLRICVKNDAGGKCTRVLTFENACQ